MKDAERKQVVQQLRDKTNAILQRDTPLSRKLAEVNERDINTLRAATPRNDDTEKDDS